MGRNFSRDSGIYVVVVVVLLLLLLLVVLLVVLVLVLVLLSPPHSSFTCFRSFAYGVTLARLAL